MKLSNVHNFNLSTFSTSEIYQDGLQLVHDAYDEVRQTAHNLSTERMIAKGLIESLESYCLQINMPSKITVTYTHFGTVPPMEGLFILDVYRVVQEVLHKITKYAAATTVIVQTVGDEHTFSISIEDNGNGINMDNLESTGLGWKNIKTRIKAWGGTVELDSRANIGNTIYLNFTLPISKPNQENII